MHPASDGKADEINYFLNSNFKIPQNSMHNMLGIRKCTLIFFVVLGMRSEGNAPKNGKPKFGFSLRQCSSTPASFGEGFPNKDQCANTEALPILS